MFFFDKEFGYLKKAETYARLRMRERGLPYSQKVL